MTARLHPVALGFGEPVHRRACPRLADRAEAKEILTDVARLSESYGTTVRTMDAGTATLLLDMA